MIPSKPFLRPAVYGLAILFTLLFQHDLRGRAGGEAYCTGSACLEKFKPVVYMYCDDDLPLSLGQIKQISSTSGGHYDIRDNKHHYYQTGGCGSNKSANTGTIYGKAIKESDGRDEYLFLQYWFLYSASRWPKWPLDWDCHEGDVEMFQVMLKRKNGGWNPLGLDLSQHHDAEFVPWNFTGHTPVVYVARGSHAIYTSAGSYSPVWNFLNDELVAIQKAGLSPAKDHTCGKERDWNKCTKLDYKLVHDNNEANEVLADKRKLGKKRHSGNMDSVTGVVTNIKIRDLPWEPPYMPGARKWGRKEGVIIERPLDFHRYASRIRTKTTMAASRNLSIALILDRSGSMSRNDPDYLRVEAAEMFLDMANDNDRFAVVVFESNAEKKYEQWGGKKLDTRSVKQSIRDVKPRGGTDIGKALSAGFSALDNDKTDKRAKAAVLLTDGRGDYNNEADAYLQNGWPIYTIGLSKNVNKRLLYKIASMTGGDYIPASDVMLLFMKFVRLWNKAKDLASIVEYGGRIKRGETLFVSFFIDPKSEIASFFLSWPGSDLDMTLISPSGKRFSAQRQGKVSKHYEMISIKPEEYGRWKAEIKAVDVPSSGEPYHFQVIADSPLKPEVKGAKSSYQRGEPVRLTLGMQGADRQTNIPEVKVIGPDGNSRPVTVRKTTGDRYTTQGVRLGKPGDHEISAKFSGEVKGHKYTRTTSKVIYVGGEEYKGRVGQVLRVRGAYIRVDIGESLGIRPGIGVNCYSGRIDPSSQTARGHIITVYPGYCDVEIDRTMGKGLIEVGDPCRLDEQDWKQD